MPARTTLMKKREATAEKMRRARRIPCHKCLAEPGEPCIKLKPYGPMPSYFVLKACKPSTRRKWENIGTPIARVHADRLYSLYEHETGKTHPGRVIALKDFFQKWGNIFSE